MIIPLSIKRILRRIKYVFLFRSLSWKYESCKDCGHCFRINWSVKDEIWEKVMGVSDGGGGSLCIDCFIERAEKKGIYIKDEDYGIRLFIPE